MKKIIMKKTLCALLIVLTLFSTCFTLLSSAHSNLKSANLQSIGVAEKHLRYDFGTNEGYIVCHIVGHYIDGKFYPAYCVNRDLHRS